MTAPSKPRSLTVHMPRPHARQAEFINSPAKRKVIRAGRRGGKTTGVGIYGACEFLRGRRVLYAAPTQEQIDAFWRRVTGILQPMTDAGILRKNETMHLIERPGTENRIRAKTAWNADTLRGDYADVLILDEYQLMSEDAWGTVGAPMLLDNNGDAIFIYTPPSLQSRSASKARDPMHAGKLFKRAMMDDTGRWQTFSFPSHENPHISETALAEITRDMTSIAYRMEIMAEDIDQAPGALWTRDIIERNRVVQMPPLHTVAVAIDPSTTAGGDEAGIMVGGAAIVAKETMGYLLEDCTIQGSPATWAAAAIAAYHRHKANYIIAEANQGGEMVALTLATIDPRVPVRLVHATRGKAVRAEPVSANYESGKIHHVGSFPALEDEMCLWTPGAPSPNRMDAAVWLFTDLLDLSSTWEDTKDLGTVQDYDNPWR